jgi:hypothetical protein
MMKRYLAAVAFLGLVSGCGGDQGQTYQVILSASIETPVCTSAGAGATGSATISVNQAKTDIAVTDFTYSGLSGPAVSAHVHYGAAGSSGPVAFDFGSSLSSPIDRTFHAADYAGTAALGAPANFASFVTALESKMAYINVHTTACGGGEIRAQIQ